MIKMDITTKKFTITLPTLIGILSVISTIIGGYWYFKNTIETTKSGITSANENYKELKEDIQILREQLYDMALAYNKNVELENEFHSSTKRHFRSSTDGKNNYRSSLKPLVRSNNKRDTIDLTPMKLQRSFLKLSK